MYSYHTALERFGRLVQFYVIDARALPSGRPLVQLTVLTDPITPEVVNLNIWALAQASMEEPELHQLADDLGVDHDWLRPVSFTVLVKNWEAKRK